MFVYMFFEDIVRLYSLLGNVVDNNKCEDKV